MKRVLFATTCVMLVICFPMTNDVTIIKSEINENRVFAGVINDQIVGTNVCCKYWLEKDIQPDTARYLVYYPMVLGQMGFVYKAEQIQ